LALALRTAVSDNGMTVSPTERLSVHGPHRLRD
jgi:hypothetical protein